MGFQADICVFEFDTLKLLHRMSLHKVKVQALCFSNDEKYLASLGGQDDNSLVIWDLNTGRPLCGGPASSDLSMCVSFFNNSSTQVVTGGHGNLRVWEIDFINRKINPEDVHLGNLQRICRTIVIEPTDHYAFVGTTSGDVLCVQLQGAKNLKFSGPKTRLPQGILCTCITDAGDLLVGSGSGEVALLHKGDLKTIKTVSLQGSITSVAAHGDHYFVGTNKSNVYYLNAKTFKEELRQTCHYERINDVCFPEGYSELFATCSNHDIRIWNARTSTELLRIQVQNLECNCVCFSPDGKSIVSGWSDGKIRAFGPQSGRLLYVINDAHKTQGMKRVSGNLSGVTALAVSHDNTRLISGGADSQVRVWRLGPDSQTMEASMKEHKATVNAICLRASDQQCVTASDDGSCIVWDLQRFVRSNIMYSQTYFKAVAYFQDESQILTTGSDRKVTYWDSYECSAIRELEGAKAGEINTLSISPNGQSFVSGGMDKILKIWSYDAGTVEAIGLGHSGNITKCVFSPDGAFVVSVGDEGSVYIWKVEEQDDLE
jgi:WD40 repeat protein